MVYLIFGQPHAGTMAPLQPSCATRPRPTHQPDIVVRTFCDRKMIKQMTLKIYESNSMQIRFIRSLTALIYHDIQYQIYFDMDQEFGAPKQMKKILQTRNLRLSIAHLGHQSTSDKCSYSSTEQMSSANKNPKKKEKIQRK